MLSRPTASGDRRRSATLGYLWGIATVTAISIAHFAVSPNILLVHEVLKRLYYVPIVVGGLHYGTRGGVMTAVLATALYLPHLSVAWSGWTAFALEGYGELVVFNVVGAVTGVLADRLRAERDRLRDSHAALGLAYQRLEASTAERIAAERLATVGRVAANVAHEVRTPLGSILGCFEILEADYPPEHPRRELLDLLKTEIGRADQVIQTLLDVAEPSTARRMPVDLNELATSASGRWQMRQTPGTGQRPVAFSLASTAIRVHVDPEQTERALEALRDLACALNPTGPVRISSAADEHVGRIQFRTAATLAALDVDDNASFILPLVHRLIAAQGGNLHITSDEGTIEFAVSLPLVPHATGLQPVRPEGRPSAT